MMSCDKDNEKTQSSHTGKADLSQQLDEPDTAKIKDGIPSLLPSSVTSSRDVTAGFTGFEGMHAHLDVKAQSSHEVPRMHSNFTAASLPRSCHQMRKFSSSTNPRCYVFTANSYSANRRVSSANDRYSLRNEFNRSGESMSPEITRGPRGHYKNFPLKLQSPAVKEEYGIRIRRHQYNLPDFQTEYETAKLYVIKSFNEDDIHKCIKYAVWTSTPNGNKKLNAAFHDAEAKLSNTGINCPVFLFFSVNASRQFVGVAEMVGPVDFKQDMNFWKLDKYNGFFPIKWHIIKDVPNNQFRHIILQSNENRPVTFSRDTQEIGLEQGLEMLKIFKSYSAKTSLLDDYDFYEEREKLFCSRRNSSITGPKREAYGNKSYQNSVKAGEKKREMQSSGARNVSSYANATSLINLTKDLSLNPSGKQGLVAGLLDEDGKNIVKER